MPASAPKGWFKRWAFGFGRAGWIGLAIVAAITPLWWFEFDPGLHLLTLSERIFGPESLYPFSKLLWLYQFGFDPSFGLASASLMVAAAMSSRARPRPLLVVSILLLGLIWSAWLYLALTMRQVSGITLGTPAEHAFDVAHACMLPLVGWLLTRRVWVVAALLVACASYPWGIDACFSVLGVKITSSTPAWWDAFKVSFNVAWHTIITLVMLVWAAGTHRAYRPGMDCPSCGYDLTGLANPKCPECGAERPAGMAASAASTGS